MAVSAAPGRYLPVKVPAAVLVILSGAVGIAVSLRQGSRMEKKGGENK